MMFFRLVLASAVLVPVLVWRVGRARGRRRGARHRLEGVRDRIPERRVPVRPDRLGREVRRLRRGRDRQRHRADLRRPARAQVQPERARERDAPVGDPRRPRSASACWPASTPRAAGGPSRARSPSSSPRSRTRARTTSSSTTTAGVAPLVIATVSCATGALILLPFAIVQWPDAVPSLEAVGFDRRARDLRDRDRAPLLLPPAQALRGVAGVARHLPAPAGRARVRRSHPGRDGDPERRARSRSSSSPESRSAPGAGARLLRRGRSAESEPDSSPSRPPRPRERGAGRRGVPPAPGVRRADVDFMVGLAEHDAGGAVHGRGLGARTRGAPGGGAPLGRGARASTAAS